MPKRPGRKSAAQTPAPKAEQIKGSSKNPKGSASSSKAGQKIRLSREIINTLTEKAKKFNEENPRKKVTLGTLKAVFRRGSGAYSSYHRPTITGGKPNSRTAWSYARVNTFLAKKAGKPTKAAYVQDDDLLMDGGEVMTKYGDGGLTAVKLYGTFDAAKDIDDIVRVSREKNIQANKLSYEEFEEEVKKHLPDQDLGFIELRLAYNELKKEYKNGGETGDQITCSRCGWSWNTDDSDPADATICHKCGYDTKQKIMKRKATGNCYQAAGDIIILSRAHKYTPFVEKQNYQGEPYLVHAEVSGQGALSGVRFGHAWIEDDLFVYDYSNNKEVVLPKELYYRIGEVDVTNPSKYRRYDFDEAATKMLETGNYGCWDLDTEYKDGGRVYKDQELLEKWKAGEKIGFSAIAHLKSKGLIPRSDGKKKKSMEDGGETIEQTQVAETPELIKEDVQEQSISVQPEYGSMIGWSLQLRMLEFAKEDAKTDMDLHKLIENLQKLPQDRMLTMDDYESVISGILEPKEDQIKENFYGIDKSLLNGQHTLNLKLADNINTNGMSKEDWAKAQTMNWAKTLSGIKKEETSEVLVDLKTGQVLGERKEFMIRREMKNGGVVMAQDLKSYNRDKVLREGYEVGTSAYLAKKSKSGDWTYVGEIVGYKELGRFKDLYVVTNKGVTIPSTQLLETKMLEKYGFKMAEGGIAPTSLDGVDLEKLDAFEKFMYDNLSQSMSKKEALQVIINNVEGDFSQLSEELEKYADYQRLEESYSMQVADEVESLKTMNDYPITLWAENQANDMSAGWEFTDIMQAVEAAKNLGIIEDNNNYEIRDTNTGRLLLNRDQIIESVLGKSNPLEFAYGGDIADEPEVMELEAETYIADQKNEAKAILYSRRMSKLQKIMYISDQMDMATNNLRQAKDGHEENIWEEVLDIWRNTFAQVERNYCERVKAEYKEGGVTSDCGCGKYYADGGLAYGNSHAKGGMPMTVKSTGQEIEIEGGEGVVNKKSMQMTKKITLNGEKMTPCEAVSEINEMGGGVKFKCDDVKEILDKDGNF